MLKLNLVVNASYWDFFTDVKLSEQAFLVNTQDSFRSGSRTYEMTRNIAGLFKSKDLDEHAVYGIEIKTNGSSRSSRIPLVRYTEKGQVIFKVVKDLEEVDNAIVYLEKLIYHLGESIKDKSFSLPSKAIIILSEEAEYLEDANMKKYVLGKVRDTRIIWFSANFLESLFSSGSKININNLLGKEAKIYTSRSL
jgi:hypothetical protein